MIRYSEPLFIKILAFGLLYCLMCAGLTGCQDKPQTHAIRFGLASAPITLDPRYATDAISSRINRLIYRQLIDFDAASQPVPSLARWQKLSPKQFRFILQADYRTFHDGTLVTARDIKATFDSILDKHTASPHRRTLHMIDKITVVDPDTVDFYLKYADPLFPGYLEIGILPAAKINSHHPFNTQPIGSGPFRFVAWPHADRLQLERVRDHQLMEFLTIKDQNTRILKLLSGEIDMLQNDIDSELIKYLEERPEVTVLTGNGSNFSYLGFNLQDKVVGQLPVRQAIAYAIDRKAIIRYLFAGRARPANALLTPDHWAGHPTLSPYPFAPEKARKRLKELGYSERSPLHITYKTSNNPFRIRLATTIQSQLADVGIQVDLQTYDWGTFYGDIKAGNFQIYSLAWVGINLPDIFRQVFHSKSVPPAGANRGRYKSDTVDRLLEKVQYEQDVEQQVRYYRQLQESLLQTLPYVPLWYEDHVFVARNSIKGYEIHIDGNYDGLDKVVRVKSPASLDNRDG